MELFAMHTTPQPSPQRLMDRRPSVVCLVILYNLSPTVCGWGFIFYLSLGLRKNCVTKNTFYRSLKQSLANVKDLSGIVSASNTFTL